MASELLQANYAAIFKALGDPTRLKIFQFLRQCSGPVAVDESGSVRRVSSSASLPFREGVGKASPQSLPMLAGVGGGNTPRVAPEGPTVGEICCHITGEERISSAISFHLKELRLAGLIQMERRGKNMICSVNNESVVLLAEYFANQPPATPGDCC